MNFVDKLEDLENKVWSSDLYVRQEASTELLTVLSEATDEVFDGSRQWDSMCGGLVRWISGTNFKVSISLFQRQYFQLQGQYFPLLQGRLYFHQ